VPIVEHGAGARLYRRAFFFFDFDAGGAFPVANAARTKSSNSMGLVASKQHCHFADAMLAMKTSGAAVNTHLDGKCWVTPAATVIVVSPAALDGCLAPPTMGRSGFANRTVPTHVVDKGWGHAASACELHRARYDIL